MPVVGRIDWIGRQVAMGRMCYISVGSAADPGKFKAKLVLAKATDGAIDAVASYALQSVLGWLRMLATNLVAVDRGHKHSNGCSEVAIWFSALPIAVGAEEALGGTASTHCSVAEVADAGVSHSCASGIPDIAEPSAKRGRFCVVEEPSSSETHPNEVPQSDAPSVEVAPTRMVLDDVGLVEIVEQAQTIVSQATVTIDDRFTPHYARMQESISTLRRILDAADPNSDREFLRTVALKQSEEVDMFLVTLGEMCDHILSLVPGEIGCDIVAQCKTKWQDKLKLIAVELQTILHDAG